MTPRARDRGQIRAVAAELGMSAKQRREFGRHVERVKREGLRGSRARGDFSYAELRHLGREFLRQDGPP